MTDPTDPNVVYDRATDANRAANQANDAHRSTGFYGVVDLHGTVGFGVVFFPGGDHTAKPDRPVEINPDVLAYVTREIP